MSTRRARALSASALAGSAPLATDPDDRPDAVIPATRHETLRVAIGAIIAGFLALSLSALHGDMLLYGDAVAHLGIARGILDTNAPGLGTLGGVWLPLPHLLMLPFVWKMAWWQDGMAGAWPSLACYIVGVMGMYRLSRRLLAPRWAIVATAFFGLNANLLYLATTAMTEPLFLALFVWMVLLTLELVEAVGRAEFGLVRSRLVLGGAADFCGDNDSLRRLGSGCGGVVRGGLGVAEGAGGAGGEQEGCAGAGFDVACVCGVYGTGGGGAAALVLVQPRVWARLAGLSAGAVFAEGDRPEDLASGRA